MAGAGQHDPLRLQPRRAPALHVPSLQHALEAVPGDGCHHWLQPTDELRDTQQSRRTALRRGCSPACREPARWPSPPPHQAAGCPSPCTAHGTAPGPGAAIATWHVSPPLLAQGETQGQQDQLPRPMPPKEVKGQPCPQCWCRLHPPPHPARSGLPKGGATGQLEDTSFPPREQCPGLSPRWAVSRVRLGAVGGFRAPLGCPGLLYLLPMS